MRIARLESRPIGARSAVVTALLAATLLAFAQPARANVGEKIILRCTHIESLRGFFPRIRKSYLIGEAAEEFAATLTNGGVPHEIDGTLDKALAAASRDADASAVAEPVVLLSPACASFDQYRNFEVRGDAFRELVQALPGLVPIKR